jgi:tRNA 2-selenouridine synthase
VDLRSPTEYARDHVPAAVNVPLFDDAARAVVGTLYHKESPARAYDEGLRIARERMPGLLAAMLGREVDESEWRARFSELSEELRAGQQAVEARPAGPDDPPPELLVHCWRGGMRSRSVAALLQRLGVRVGLLQGGYKAYRAWVLERIEAFPPEATAPGGMPWFVLVAGATGTGKTLLLRLLEEAEPGCAVDLEGLAEHRSSILGAVGRQPVGQALFETRLAARLDELGPPPWFVEAESRKVGDVVLPAALFTAMRAGHVVELEADAAFRVQVLCDDYLATPDSHAEIAARLPFLEERLGGGWGGRLSGLLDAGDYAEVVRLLLENYYDPLYAHSGSDLAPARRLAAAAPDLVVQALAERAAVRAAGASRPASGG